VTRTADIKRVARRTRSQRPLLPRDLCDNAFLCGLCYLRALAY